MVKSDTYILKSFVVILFVLMLTACGGGSTDTAAPNKATSAAESGGKQVSQQEQESSDSKTSNTDSVQTKTIQTATGQLEIPVNPKRIVMDGYLPNMLILGIKPVGAMQWDLDNKVIKDQIAGIESVGERSLEKMLDLDPDLIVTWLDPKYDGKIIEQYNKIAPTIVLPYNYFSSIYESTRYFGDIFDKQKEAEQWLTEFDQDSAEARTKINKVVKPKDTFALMGVFVVDSAFYIYGDGGYRGGEAIYQHLKLNPPPKQKQEMIGKQSSKKVSFEVVHEYAGDYIFLDQGKMIAEVWGSNEGVWKSLDAVKNNRVFDLDPDLFWGNDPISLKLQIKELAKMITERAK
ncbi:ABC transporter substrate-binding protein [Paenibacillus sp. ACRRX]|uniref:ABC transporter substrate-binding protein n=1 Tax=unclassified Paenibacillus TaxID=185978 RepID=UPI001EF4881F|nr:MULTISPECIES: ABC transporter substrate-binding protein [unclassified Paenibacillus]MCG7409255.1 ABC transporter substrate-binding protein [Paenibacillus sp. ACRRX]MDK8179910.1 ABC transporter substrate-binding protein [Paenibacillus sp. UMB4589-SE434]